MASPLPYEISPQETKAKLDAAERVTLVDCREPIEHSIAHLDGAHLIPMNNIPSRLNTLESVAEESLVIVYCHHGMRSMNVVNWLRQQGVENCQSMAGGIDRWSLEIDSTVPRY
jgi:rhodanese-related sulfurtransferase